MKNPRAGVCFLEVVRPRTAGSPQDKDLYWTHYSVSEIIAQMSGKGFPVTRHDVRNLMGLYDYKRRSLVKTVEFAQVEGRNAQFEKIENLIGAFSEAGNPIFSLDTKNKELLGNFHRPGTYFGTEPQKVLDHDFVSFAEGKVIPHGIYDVNDNRGYLTLGTSKDTSEFACDNFEHFWEQTLQWKYPGKDWVLFLCDSGGSNNCRHYLFKEDVYKLAQRLHVNILVAHYPTYCSKYNPIEHRFFPHVHRAWQGSIFKNIQVVKELAEKTSTETGLSIDVRLNKKDYSAPRKYRTEFKSNIEDYINFDQFSPKWNYSAQHKVL